MEQVPQAEEREPLLLLALNSTDAIEWEDLQEKASRDLLVA